MKSKDLIGQDLDLMATYFKDIKIGKNTNANIRGIERILGRAFDLNVKIQIVNNNTGKFFGMTVTPERMDRILMAILEERSSREKLYEVWREEKNWVIEIDDLLLYDKNLNANPHEIVAVLLHELGHVVYSNEAVSRANRVIKMSLMEAGMKYKKVLSERKFSTLLQLPLYESCNTKRFKIRRDNDREEYIADKFVTNYGYGQYLVTFIEKLLKTHGNSLIDRPSSDMDSDVAVLVKWSVENVASLEFRKNKLKNSMKIEQRRTPSKVIKSIVTNINETIFGKDDGKDMVEDIMREQYLYEELDRLMEKAISTDTKIKHSGMLKSLINQKRLKKIEVKELDILEVEIDRIEYHDDKIYVLELVHEMIEKITHYLDLIESGQADRVPQSKQSLLSLYERVTEMRTRLIHLKIQNPTYGLFVKYPESYEG